MIPRLNLITLAVADVGVSRNFYEKLGWQAKKASNPHVAFFDLNGVILSLYGQDDLARDTGTGGTRPGSVTLAINFGSRQEVDSAMAEVAAAGGGVLVPAGDTFWGGYAGYAADPDGHIWEFAWAPMFAFDGAGHLVLD